MSLPAATHNDGLWTGDWARFVHPHLSHRAGWPTLAAALVAGVLTDAALRAGVPTLASAILIAVTSIVLLATRVRSPQAVACVAAAPVFGSWLAVRSSPWLVVPDVLAAGVLLVAGVTAARTDLGSLSLPRAAAHAVRGAVQGLLGPAFAADALRGNRMRNGTAWALARGLAIAVPLVLVLGALLASADAVFASFISVHPRTAIEHAVLTGVGAWTMLGLLRAASVDPVDVPALPAPHLGPVEWTTTLVTVDLLFAGFAWARLAAMGQGGRRVIQTAGLTYAQYARSGFFQLLAVAAITASVLLAVRAAAVTDTPSRRRRFTVLAVVTIVLTQVVVVSALQRLMLYREAFGWTMLRLYATVVVVWIGAVLMLLAMAVARGNSRWLMAGASGLALVALLGLNVTDPEASVARSNIDQTTSAGVFDTDYTTATLGHDAAPAIVAAWPRLLPEQQEVALANLCPGPGRPSGLANYNRARDRAALALAGVCPPQEGA